MKRSGIRGMTLMELLVTIAILGLVMALLGFPLMAAFGYIQKLTARSEARRAGSNAIEQFATDLAEASYIFDPPIDGSWIAFVKESPGYSAKSLGMPMTMPDVVNPQPQATLLRYSQTPDFPWRYDKASNTWIPLKPNYLTVTASADVGETFNQYHAPYYSLTSRSEPNPYILARLENTMSWASAQSFAVDGQYPLSTYPVDATRWQLWRMIRQDMVSVTPYGPKWDVARFQVIPRPQSTEPLLPLVDAKGRKDITTVLTRFPLIAGRSRDIDDLYQKGQQAILPGVYGQLNIPDLRGEINLFSPLYPIPTNSRDNTNPFGYQLRVFKGGNDADTLVYGIRSNGQPYFHRHYMEWPPQDRPDWPAGVYPSVDPDAWNEAKLRGTLLWTPEEIKRQRLEGKFVFVQPMRADALPVYSTNPERTYLLPIPTGGSTTWDADLTYRVAAPPRIVWHDGTTARAFKLVDKAPEDLGTYEYCLVFKVRGLDDARRYGEPVDPQAQPPVAWQEMSRVIAFGAGMTDTTNDPLPLAEWIRYTICDLQPTDTVVATYSTKAILNVALIVSRQDTATRDRARSRQDSGTNVQVEAKNAAKRARGVRER